MEKLLLEKRTMLSNRLVQISGSKSISNRLLILDALYKDLRCENLSDSQDTKVLQKALSSTQDTIDIHHAGTAMRFLTAYFAIQSDRSVILTGSTRMKQRPISELVHALRDLGADITFTENEGYPPLQINGRTLKGGTIHMPGDVSSQFISALLLIGPFLAEGLEIHLIGDILSRPYIEMTLTLLKKVGFDSQFKDNVISVSPYNLESSASQIRYFHVESDWSSASYYYSMAAISRQSIRLKNFKNYSYQGDSQLKEIYWKYFGINTVTDIQELSISLLPENHQSVSRIELDMRTCPDLAQTLCITAAAKKIPFQITGLKTLKIKETDRLLALHNELKKIGCNTIITEESIESTHFFEISEPIEIQTYNDHRMALSFAPYALIQSLTIQDPNVVEKSYPMFWNHFDQITEIIES